MPRTVITGGAGFLGSHLADALLERGHDVVCIDNLITGNIANIEHLFGNEYFHFIRHDVTNYIHVPGPVDNILHFASPASPIDYLKFPIQTLKVVRWEHIKPWDWRRKRKPVFCWHPLRRSMVTRWCTHKRRITGEM
jgi:hypothetical protein